MLRNYLKIAWRNIARHKGYTAINIFGLAIGLACCTVIFLYVNNELSYDQYHEDVDRIYRIAEHRRVKVGEFRSATVCPALGPAIKAKYPQAEHVVRIDPVIDGLVQCGQKSYYESRVFYADPDLFEVFSIPFTQGDPATALNSPLSAVITRTLAEKYFGDVNPIGQTISVKDPLLRSREEPDARMLDYQITGVVENAPSNTHFKYNLLLSLKVKADLPRYEIWDGGWTYTYVKLAAGVAPASFEDQIRRVAYDYYGEELTAWGQEREYYLQPLKDIHFNSRLAGFGFRGNSSELEPPGNMLHIYVYSAIGLLVLLIGCMNFVNLSNARAVYRAREVGLRKVAGALRFQLARQFLGESILTTLMAMAISFALVELLLPPFNQLAGTTLTISGLMGVRTAVGLIVLILGVGCMAGGYPALVLSNVRPVASLSGASTGGSRGSFVLKGLVLGQFVIAIVLAVGGVIVYQQLAFMQSKALGFESKQRLVLPFHGSRAARDKWPSIKDELLGLDNVLSATASSSVPGRYTQFNHIRRAGESAEQSRQVRFLAADYDFMSVYEIGLVAGRALSEERNDRSHGFLINEAACKLLGWSSPAEALGQSIREGFSAHTKEIVGVASDFHMQGMQASVEPLLIEYSPVSMLYNYLTLDIATNDLERTLIAINDRWNQFFPDMPCEGYFLDADFATQYQREGHIARLLGVLSGLGLLVGCLGLLGLACFATEKRTREIGIRKAMGASVTGIVRLFSKEFALVVFVAGLVACPIAYYVMELWLQDFAHRVTMNWLSFVLPSVTALALSILVVGFQAMRAARANPVEALRHE